MKIKLCLLLAGALAASCSGNNSKNNDSASVSSKDTLPATAADAPPVNMQYCFYHTDGTQAQDTTSVSMLINGNKVTGKMSWIPKEKDARKGTIEGTLKENAIKAVWTYGQEGSKDTMTVDFQLRGNALAQKPYKYDAKTGRQLTNEKADYTVIYSMKNCGN
ncbi:hypothetical protein [Mucilaginibacter aquaedulcis]|jgi:hypothetical protein|uniref:hypothetical protein n=1 Tax=Mucilaginibacter aquaedulcis TaxID=1187081 RepID=UPI0025B2F432|nr:hypothetical protein [Mucilaginibacter aquaedulcis]MDN3547096.1 hypothetical protein [Mucilaginibacter aquaedulcis]